MKKRTEKLKLWRLFVRKAKLLEAGLVRDNMSFAPGTDPEQMDILMQLFVAFLRQEVGVPFSSIMTIYSESLKPSKRAGLPVDGLKRALKGVYEHQAMHIKVDKTALPQKVGVEIISRLTCWVFGERNKRLPFKSIDPDKLRFFVIFISYIFMAIRKTELLPQIVTVDPDKTFLVPERDISFHVNPKMVELRYVKKQDRQNKSYKVTHATWAPLGKKDDNYQTVPVVGPYRALQILMLSLTPRERNSYIHKKYKNQDKWTVYTVSNLDKALNEGVKESGARKYVNTIMGTEVPITFSSMRSFTMTTFESCTNSPEELRLLSKHKSCSTTYDNYVFSASDKKSEVQLRASNALTMIDPTGVL